MSDREGAKKSNNQKNQKKKPTRLEPRGREGRRDGKVSVYWGEDLSLPSAKQTGVQKKKEIEKMWRKPQNTDVYRYIAGIFWWQLKKWQKNPKKNAVYRSYQSIYCITACEMIGQLAGWYDLCSALFTTTYRFYSGYITLKNSKQYSGNLVVLRQICTGKTNLIPPITAIKFCIVYLTKKKWRHFLVLATTWTHVYIINLHFQRQRLYLEYQFNRYIYLLS